MQKLLAMNIAAALTGAVISNLEDNLTIDVDVKDPNLRAENLMTWELFRIFYHAVKSAVEDDEHWPAPAVDVTGLFQSAAEGLMGIVQNNPLVSQLIQRFLGNLAAPESLPNPGENG